MRDWDKIAQEMNKICAIEREVSLAQLTSFGVGGPARILAQPADRNELAHCLKFIQERELDFFIIGNGTNLLISDKGFDGVIVGTSYDLDEIEQITDDLWQWGAGVSLWRAITHSADENYAGLEPLAGIPGSVGGATVMNANAYGVSFFDKVQSVEILIPDKGYVQYKPEQLNPSYRKVNIPHRAIVTAVQVKLEHDEGRDIKIRINDFLTRRSVS
ncbi:hypothetical protein DRQ33_07575, partial [bacterium]